MGHILALRPINWNGVLTNGQRLDRLPVIADDAGRRPRDRDQRHRTGTGDSNHSVFVDAEELLAT